MARKGKDAGESRYLPCRTHVAGEGLSLRRENSFEFPGYALAAPGKLLNRVARWSRRGNCSIGLCAGHAGGIAQSGYALVAPGRPIIRVMRCGARDTAVAFIAVRWGMAKLEALCCFAGKSAYFRTEKPNAGHRKTAMRRAFIYKNADSQESADAQGLSCKTADPWGSAGDRTGVGSSVLFTGAWRIWRRCAAL